MASANIETERSERHERIHELLEVRIASKP